MAEMDIHDLSDDADYAASQQQGSGSIMRSGSESRSEPESVEMVYVKDSVAVHPTQYMFDRISGRLELMKQGGTLFMSWIPYDGQNSNTRLSEKDRNLYTIELLPFPDIRSIRRHTPAFGWQYVIVVLSSGLAFPPLYFYNGGVREFLVTIKQHVSLVRSAEDANVFVLNNFQDPLQKTLSSLELLGVVSDATPSTSILASEPSLTAISESVGENKSVASNSVERQRPWNQDPAKDLSIQVLEKFSLVTKFARETTSQLFNEGNAENFLTKGRRKRNQGVVDHPPESVSSDVVKIAQKPSEYLQQVSEVAPVPADPLEFEKLVLVWGKPRQSPLAQAEWLAFLDSEGRIIDSKALKKRIFYGGVDHELRGEVWPFLLGCYDCDSTYGEREHLRSSRKQEFEIIMRQWQRISPEQAKRFTKFRERKGLIDKDVVRTDRSVPFYDGDDNPNVTRLHDILLTYSFYNFDLGYCQGMSDLLSPILYVMDDDSEAFWCFTFLMERLGPNFHRDQSGMHSQLFALSKNIKVLEEHLDPPVVGDLSNTLMITDLLMKHRYSVLLLLVELLDSPLHKYFEQNDCLNYFFCFRWILIQFKRELEYSETMRMWEVLWTNHLTEHLHLYICVALLKRYRRKIIGEQMDFDTLLKFINELSGHIELEATLRDAEALCIHAGENGAACIPPGTPPSLPVDSSLVQSQLEDEVL